MTDFTKRPGSDSKTISEKLGPEMTRALMTSSGKSLLDAVANYQQRTGRTIHNPLANQCNCTDCQGERAAKALEQGTLNAMDVDDDGM